MQYVQRSDCPTLLTTNHEIWTQPWVAHYRWHQGDRALSERPSKPNDGHWRENDIRLPLIADFHNNCGYCGFVLPTPLQADELLAEFERADEQERAFSSKGDVDHLLPKAIYPEQVYQWTNYIWSCKACNQQKREFDNIEYPLLNPCSESDCANLIYVEENGQYVLQDYLGDNQYWQKRLENSQINTLMNAVEIRDERKLKTRMLRGRFDSIKCYLSMFENSQKPEFQSLIDTDLVEICEILGSPSFHLLLQSFYQSLLTDYPQVALLLIEQNELSPE
jgi:hypothetical protein